jgi:hypothetical protein
VVKIKTCRLDEAQPSPNTPETPNPSQIKIVLRETARSHGISHVPSVSCNEDNKSNKGSYLQVIGDSHVDCAHQCDTGAERDILNTLDRTLTNILHKCKEKPSRVHIHKWHGV